MIDFKNTTYNPGAMFDEQDAAEKLIDPSITEAWKAARLGRFTSSQIAKLLVKSKAKGETFGEGAKTYIYKKAAETLTLEANETTSAAIKWGNEHEPFAAREFSHVYKKEIEYYGKENPVFIAYGNHAGGSKDGFILDENAIIEFKCPFESGYHAELLHKVTTNTFSLKEYEKDYYGQVQFNMFLEGEDCKHGYFVSYDPRVIDPRFAVIAVKVDRDEDYLKELLERLELAIAEKVKYLTEIGYYSADEAIKAAA